MNKNLPQFPGPKPPPPNATSREILDDLEFYENAQAEIKSQFEAEIDDLKGENRLLKIAIACLALGMIIRAIGGEVIRYFTK